jgi:16S rRNA (guanine527-N7)-methyltransferase
MFHVKHVDLAAPPPTAAQVFGDRLSAAVRFAELLASVGVERGLIGPREAERVWERHILNCAAIANLLPTDARVADVGSGAGLPGIPLALARPDLRVTLVEPMLRRTTFLDEVVTELGLAVEIVRGRVEDPAVRNTVGDVDAVVCRAVAALDKLAAWCLPLLRPSGQLLAIKGEGAAEEVERERRAIAQLGGGTIGVVRCGGDYLDPPTTVVVVKRGTGKPRHRQSARGNTRRRA